MHPIEIGLRRLLRAGRRRLEDSSVAPKVFVLSLFRGRGGCATLPHGMKAGELGQSLIPKSSQRRLALPSCAEDQPIGAAPSFDSLAPTAVPAGRTSSSLCVRSPLRRVCLFRGFEMPARRRSPALPMLSCPVVMLRSRIGHFAQSLAQRTVQCLRSLILGGSPLLVSGRRGRVGGRRSLRCSCWNV